MCMDAAVPEVHDASRPEKLREYRAQADQGPARRPSTSVDVHRDHCRICLQSQRHRHWMPRVIVASICPPRLGQCAGERHEHSTLLYEFRCVQRGAGVVSHTDS